MAKARFIETGIRQKFGEALLRGLVKELSDLVDKGKITTDEDGSQGVYGCFGLFVMFVFGVSQSTLIHYAKCGIQSPDTDAPTDAPIEAKQLK